MKLRSQDHNQFESYMNNNQKNVGNKEFVINHGIKCSTYIILNKSETLVHHHFLIINVSYWCLISVNIHFGHFFNHWLIKVGLKSRFQSFIEFAFSVLLETRKSLLCVQLKKITISSLKVFLEGF